MFHPFISVTIEIENFIISNINKINSKNNTFLVVQTDIDTKIFQNKGYEMDQGLFEKLIFDYNSKLDENESKLETWKRF